MKLPTANQKAFWAEDPPDLACFWGEISKPWEASGKVSMGSTLETPVGWVLRG